MKGLLLSILLTCSCLLNALNVYSQTISGTITGPSDVCGGTTVQYTVSGSSALSGYTWTLSSNATILSGQGSKTINVSFGPGQGNGVIYVSGNGLIAIRTNIHITTPASAPTAITGPSIVCKGSTATYTTSPGAASDMSFTWYASDESSITSQTSSSAVVTFPNRNNLTSTTINFFTVNGVCGPSPTVSKTMTYESLNPAVTMSNNGILCPGGSVTLTAAPGYVHYNFIKNETQYVGGSNNNFYAVTAAGSYTVWVNSQSCSMKSNTVVVTALTSVPPALTISGTSIICRPGDQGIVYSVPGNVDVVPTSYVWSVPSGATIASGQNSNSITVNYSSAFSGGSVGVYGTNCAGNGPSSSFAVSRLPAPGVPGTIIGPTQVCSGQAGQYSLPASVTNATGYAWTIPADATLLSGQNTTSITVAFADTPGSISVAGTNCNGVTGSLSTLPITFNNLVAASNVNYAVDNVTGTLSASLPLFSVQNGDVGLSGVMSYTGSGVTISADDGWLGQNWGLSVQSYGVFREMRNLPDDYSSDTRIGWLFGTARTVISNPSNFNLAQDNDLSTCADELQNYNTLTSLTFAQDTEPDAYHVSAPGLSLDFYFDENRVPHAVPLQDVVITPYTANGAFNTSTTTGPITSFTIKDSKGITYTFSEIETLTENIFQVSQYYFVRKSNQHHQQFTYTTSWRLTSINSPLYGSINMTYTSVSLSNPLVPNPYPSKGVWAGVWSGQRLSWDLRYNYRYPLVTSNASGAGATLAYTRSSVIKIPAWITSSTTDVEFISEPKYAGSPMQRLAGISIYDKREGNAKLVRSIRLYYYALPGTQRAFLGNISMGVAGACTQASYSFEYNNDPGLPDYSSTDKDEWGLYKVKDGSYIYDETAVAGSLRKINQPFSGYAVFFYQTHDYWNGTATVKGGGIRVKKIISYDAVSSDHDIVQEFYYTATNGQSSGKLQHKAGLSFSVVKNDAFGTYPAGYRYNCFNSFNCPMFTLQGDQDMSPSSLLNGSVVGYERVTVKTLDGGQSVYEYDLPASADDVTANNGEWTPSKVLIARGSTGLSPSQCFETGTITEGFNRYPFPVNPNYEFARGLLKKVTHFDINGVTVSDVIYTYQRVYGVGNSGIRKIYGLAMEELPTYYFNGSSNVDGKMFLYSRYQIFTDVKVVPSTQTETVYNNPTDLTQNSQTRSSYFYTSPNHRELSRVESKNSDGTTLVNTLTYTKDYDLTSPGDAASVALANLKAAHRVFMVESISSKVLDPTTNVTTFVGGSLTVFQTIGGKVFPYKQHSFMAPDGASSFTPSSVTSGSFQCDPKYVLQKTYTGFDSYGNTTSVVDRSRNISSVAYGYSGTLPIVTVSNAGTNEIAYSGFDTSTPADFVINGFTPTYSVGRSGSTSKGLNLPAGSANTLTLPALFSNNKSSGYVLSFWIKSPSSGTLTITVNGSSPSTITRNFTASDYTYYTVNVPKSSTSFTIALWSNASIQVDDLSFYPAKADIASSTYAIPQGKTSDTDSRGASNFYDNDAWGRPIAVYDRYGNLVKKYDYQVRP